MPTPTKEALQRGVPASERTHEALRDLIEGRSITGDARSELIRLATRLIVEEGLEAEVRETLECDYYERGADYGGGYRNDVRKGRLRTAEGLIDYSVPQISGRDEPSTPSCGRT